MLILFWICAGLIVYVYVGYPLLLVCGLLGRKKSVGTTAGGIQPSLSVLIPAHNEEKAIRSKLMNLLSQSYPPEKLQIIVGDDGSSDATAQIVSEFAPRGVQLVRGSSPKGKSIIQNALVPLAKGEILVFTDADCFLPVNALRVLAQNFADPEIGLVTNCASIQNRGETSTVEGEGLYWRYERWLRMQESDRGLLAMASGSLFAMRRALWAPLNANVGDDFALPLHVAKAGYRNVLDTRVSAVTVLTQNRPASMFRMKMRIISKDLRGLLRTPACLNPFRVGRVAISLWSHKLLRWAIPYFLIGMLVSSVSLAGIRFYALALSMQLAFYTISGVGLLLESRRIRFPLAAISSFCLVNLAALCGTLHCCTLQPAGRWKPVR
jgi:cellulose synthase/poly-beta-1,6-N-acetylglucosamine synthase-like glycosyltransferase